MAEEQKPQEEKKLPDKIQYLVDKITEKGLTIKFGLEAQGHIPTIEKMIEEYSAPSEINPEGIELSQSIHLWEKIAKEIGWDTKTLMAHYISYLRKPNKK